MGSIVHEEGVYCKGGGVLWVGGRSLATPSRISFCYGKPTFP